MIGRTLSHFKITAKLGEGGMGEVYLAVDTQLERKVALKVLPADLAQDPERLRRLEREAKSLAALDHPHIVPIYSLETAEGVHFLTMAFIDGEPLDRLIPEEGFPVERVLELAVQLADALRAAHQRGIIHRDLKPANVMVDRDGRLRVLDFGLAKREALAGGDLSRMLTQVATEQMTSAGVILGTFPYMSPEQAEGRVVDARSDLFSLGVMLYELACGRRPFHGESELSLITSILRDPPAPIAQIKPGLPARLVEILDRCLRKDPDERYRLAEELRDDLQGLQGEVAGGTAAAAPSVPPSQLRTAVAPSGVAPVSVARPASRRAIWLVAVLVAIAVAAVGIWTRWPGAEPTQSLAVLPFENLMEDDEVEYLCDGVGESLARQLSTLPGVRVAPRSAALHFKGQGVDPVEAGRQLGVDNVVAGDLSLEGDRLYVTAKLVHVERRVELWSNTYDRDAGELLDIQDEIASAILNDGLRLELTTDEQAELVRTLTRDGEAYDLFLQARYLQRRATEDDYLQAIELLQRATVRDPGFAGAYLMLSGIHAGMAIDGYMRPTDGWALANRYLRQGLAIEPDLPAHPIRHGLAFFFDWDWQGAERERRMAMQLPVGEFDPDGIRTYSFELLAMGKPEEALEMARRARELDPLSIGLAMLEADYLVRNGEIDAAIALYQRTIEVEPDNPEQYFGLAEALVEQRRYDEAIEARRQAHEVAGDEEMAALFAAAQGEEGYRQADEAWVRMQLLWLEARSAWAYVSPLDFARAYAQLGNEEKAFEYLEQAFADRSPGLVLLKIDRAFDGVRDDPRFAEAVERVGLPSA